MSSHDWNIARAQGRCCNAAPDSEVFPVAIMGTSLEGKGGQPNGVGPIEGIEGEVVDFHCLHTCFLAEHLLDYHIQRHLVKLTLQRTDASTALSNTASLQQHLNMLVLC